MDKKINLRKITKKGRRVSHKIDYKAVWPRNGHAASVGVNQKYRKELLIRFHMSLSKDFTVVTIWLFLNESEYSKSIVKRCLISRCSMILIILGKI